MVRAEARAAAQTNPLTSQPLLFPAVTSTASIAGPATIPAAYAMAALLGRITCPSEPGIA